MTSPVNLLVKALAKQDPLYQPLNHDVEEESPEAEVEKPAAKKATTEKVVVVEPAAGHPTIETREVTPEEDLSPTEREIREFFQRSDEGTPEMVEVSEPKFEVIEENREQSDLERHFLKVLDKIELEVGFDATWANGTGYLDGAVYDNDVELEVGQMAKTVDDNDRRIILIQTPYGTVVFFERYTPKYNDGSFVVCAHVPEELKYFARMDGSVTDADFVHFSGLFGRNIGTAVADLLNGDAE